MNLIQRLTPTTIGAAFFAWGLLLAHGLFTFVPIDTSHTHGPVYCYDHSIFNNVTQKCADGLDRESGYFVVYQDWLSEHPYVAVMLNAGAYVLPLSAALLLYFAFVKKHAPRIINI
jgi:hypothetical protein